MWMSSCFGLVFVCIQGEVNMCLSNACCVFWESIRDQRLKLEWNLGSVEFIQGL